MKNIIQYLKCVFASNKYLLFAIPLIAFVLFGVGLYFLSSPVFDGIVNSSSIIKSDEALISTSRMRDINWTVVLVIVLPFFYLTIIPMNFKKSYDFILPIKTSQKLITYCFIGLIIYLYNLLIVLGLNYIVELFYKQTYWNAIIEAFDRKGHLYLTIEKNSIFYSGKNALQYFNTVGFFLMLFPFYLVASLYFKKYSFLISLALIVTFMIFGTYLGSKIWTGNSNLISNQTYLMLYKWLIIFIPAVLCYIGFYFFLKEKEV